MPTKRRTGAAAVSRSGVKAGTIESSSGRARVTPIPCRNVRRGMCRLVTNIGPLLVGAQCTFMRLDAHLELRTLHDAEHDRREAVVVGGRIPDDRADGWHVGVFHAAAQSERHQL